LRSELARVLSLAPSRIDNDKAFGAMGLDSLMAVTFVRRLSASLGILLPATAAFNYPTISALALHVAGKLGLEVEIRKEPPPARRSQSPHSAQNGHELTDEQAIEALLAERGTP
jgi:acyl carrier protein